MKIKILILVLSVLTTVVYGQEKTYAHYIQQLDSLKKVYSVEDIFYFDYSNTEFLRKLFDKNNLSINEKQILIDKVNHFYEQKQYIGLYYVAAELLANMYSNFEEKELRQNIIYMLVNKVFYTDTQCRCWFRLSEYSTDSTKIRLKEIMQSSLNEKEKSIQIRAQEVAYRTIDVQIWEKTINKIMKTTKRKGKKTHDFLMDSLKNNYINQRMDMWFSKPDYTPLTSDCIYYIGSMNDTTFIPYLEEYQTKYPQKRACTYALAKLGVQRHLDEIYASEKINYEYLGTQEAFLKELDKQFVWNKSSHLFSNQAPRPSALIILEEAIMYYLKNIPRDIKKEFWNLKFVVPENIKDYDPTNDEQNKESIKTAYKLYNWIKENTNVWEMPSAQDRF